MNQIIENNMVTDYRNESQLPNDESIDFKPDILIKKCFYETDKDEDEDDTEEDVNEENKNYRVEARKNFFKRFKKCTEEKGGKLLHTDPLDYVNWKTKLNIKCQDGHVFDITFNNLDRGRWCPKCKINIGEFISKCSIEHLLKKSFKKIRPNWLKYNGSNLEIDIYNEEENLGIEYNGIMHYKMMPFFHKTIEDFEKRQEYDRVKYGKCLIHNTKLIVIPYTVKFENICQYIYNKLTNDYGYKIDIEILNSFDIKDYYKNLSKTSQIEALILEKEGILIDGIVVHRKSPLTVRCKYDHEFITNAHYIKRGNWCKKCGFKVSEKTKQKISDTLKSFNKTDKGKNIKKIAIKKISTKKEIKDEEIKDEEIKDEEIKDEEIKDKKNSKYECVCGSNINKKEIRIHETSKKHIKFLENHSV